ncbi:MAG TPA: 4-hydroxy-tetrahydrodipicolinate synthase [Longimicrobiaceae bacterium]|nr:4-hydroxy-tetrahydrodipicolinate synthase [Longimicrobiaceae bacterium]
MTPLFDGSGVALVTPFRAGGVNERVLAELAEFQIVEGTEAIVVCGSTGEAATMSADEQARVVAVAVEAAAKRVPVVAGAGGSDTAAVSQLARNAQRAGADALLISAPPYNKPTQRGMVAHYRAVMAAGKLPAIIYNVPSRTSCNILPETVEEIASDPQVVGVKEASGDISQMAELCRRLADRVAIYSGNDDQVIPLLALGGRGVISVIANIAPRDTSRMVHLFLDGRIEEARELQFRYLPLAKALFSEPNPVPVKAAVKALGFDVGGVRLPLLEISDAGMALVRERMAEVGISARVGV